MTRDKLLTQPVKEEIKVRVGSMEMDVAMDAARAARLRQSIPYRYVIRPALRRMRVRSNGNGAKAHVYTAGHAAPKPAVIPAPDTPEARAIVDKISGYDWYHTINLGHGVYTPGYVDHRDQLAYYMLPEDMTGMRVLDVATFDGFWAFEFERRGAQVTAIDVASTTDTDIPRNWRDVFQAKGGELEKGEGFRLASEILGSSVKKEICSVYDISRERLGTFDMVFCSDLLIHLRDPLAAIEAIWNVTDSFAVFADVYHPELEAFKQNALVEFCQAGQSDVWWRPSVRAYRLWLMLARFSRIEEKSRFVLEARYRSEIPKVVFHAYK